MPSAASSAASPPSLLEAGAQEAAPVPSVSASTAASTAPSSSAAGQTDSPFADLSTLLSGPPDPSVKLGPLSNTTLEELALRPPAGWSLLTDPDLGWELSSPDNRIRLFLTSVKKGTVPRPPKDELSLGYRLSQVRSGPTLRTTVGEQSLPLQVGQGTAQIDGQKERGAILYFVVESSSRDVSGTALFRAGRSTAQEKALIASLRSIRKGK